MRVYKTHYCKHSPGLILISLIFFIACTTENKEVVSHTSTPEQIDFNYHIRPILSDRCFPCHGPDEKKREADLRLDLESGLFGKTKESGKYPFAKNNLRRSEAWLRIISDDPEYAMPPPNSNLTLDDHEVLLIKKWVSDGAKWKKHWAFIPPEKTEIPEDVDNPIDYFIRKKQKSLGLSSSPLAEKARLIRRVSFDLTGLPPSLEEIDHFLNDDREDAYEKLVEYLMQKDSYAERMTMEWLDVARYADSHGMHADGIRTMWPWRDWVIKAFKDNMPYDRFVTWQIAGDLIPDAGTDQILATGFFRNQPLNSELGIVPEEFRLKYVADRTNTTATAFLGLTFECAECHDHKFDPITQREFYETSSFFNNVNELGMIGNDRNFGPLLPLINSSTQKKLDSITDEINELERIQKMSLGNLDSIAVFIKGIDIDKTRGNKPVLDFAFDRFEKSSENDIRAYIDKNKHARVNGTPDLVDGIKNKAIRIDSDYDIIHFDGTIHPDLFDPFSGSVWARTEKRGEFQGVIGNIGDKNTGWRGWLFYLDTLGRPALILSHSLSHNLMQVVGNRQVKNGQWTHLAFAYDGSVDANGIRLYLDGDKLETEIIHNNLYKTLAPVQNRNYIPYPEKSVRMGFGSKYLFAPTDDGVFKGAFDEVKYYDRYITAIDVGLLYRKSKHGIADVDFSKKNKKEYFSYYFDSAFISRNRKLWRLRKEKYSLLGPVQEVMVMQEMREPRVTHLLERGQYDRPMEAVGTATPRAILPFPEHLPKNRLGFATWLFDKANPLTARVTVNRYWQMVFGRGIVDTPHDFGSQGSLPSHPELLDWLAVYFIESDWDVKALLGLMVTSDTYKQSSAIRTEHQVRDPKNIYLSRAPSYRLPFEMIRDHALASSGLLNTEVGGESVKPYQPPDLWKEKNEFSGYLKTYVRDSADDLYRRSMYTFIRRTIPPPAMITFDAPGRDKCTVTRERTNTPLQALVLLNDPQFVEAARVLAVRIQKEMNNATLEKQLSFGFRLLFGKSASSTELKLMQNQFSVSLEKFTKNPSEASKLLNTGEFPVDPNLDHEKTAALAMVANTLMNYDEFYMKR